jgi:hypothetical protein
MRVPRPDDKPTRLKITDDKGFERVVLIDRAPFPLGTKAPGGLELPPEPGDPVTERHALILQEEESYVLEDRSGSCGTRVNGRPIRRTRLKHGDDIRLGKSAYRIVFLIEGTRAADEQEKRVRTMLKILLELHACEDDREVPARAAAGIMQVLSPAWLSMSLVTGGGAPGGPVLQAVVGVDAAGDLPTSPTTVARHVAESGRTYYQPDRLCVAIVDRASSAPVAVVDVGPREKAPYVAADVEMLESMAAHIGIALARARRRRDGVPAQRVSAGS